MRRRLSAGGALVVRAPAKVNLFLEVLGKRPDGYHEILTFMAAVRLYDTLRIESAPEGDVRLTCNEPAVPTGDENLIVRAAQLLRDASGAKHGARIRLTKRIPMQAGLAGGSTDAAAALLGLNDVWQTGLSPSELEQLSSRLGSDIPFFFHLPAGWCSGRGEIVAPAPLPRPLDLVLVCPPVGCSTPAVYRNVRLAEHPDRGEAFRLALQSGDVEAIGQGLRNRLEPAARVVAPVLAELAMALADLHPAGRLMSGSGSTMFALCRSPVEADSFARQLRSRAMEGTKIFVLRTCTEQQIR